MEEQLTQDPEQEIQQAIDAVEAHLRILTQKPKEEMLSELTDFEVAQYRTTLAYAVTTLQLCYLKSKGEDVENHPNMRHLERLKIFFPKMARYIDLSAKDPK